ncbi:MAG: sugar phosphate isomerase/epimerase [Bifidobacteriaceae bacterium]|jgi:sugar phosphate isomerase/epimerase|nr:sugar phosphate isomerase/epimerase [Bifidobacteriaceae bacterium]
MRVSLFPKGELDDLVGGRTDVNAWIAQAASLPIDGVELYFRFFPAGDPAAVRRVGEALAAADIAMPMLCVSPDFAHPDPGVRRQQIDEYGRFITIARELGGAGASCRVLSGQRHPGVDPDQGVQWVVEAFEELIPTARELDVVLAFENHYKDGYWTYPEFAQRRQVYMRILDAIDERLHFGVQFDPSNAIMAGEDSVDLLRSVINRVVTMQASDRQLAPGATLESLRRADGTVGYSPDLRHGVIGQGLNDYPAIFGLLRDGGYDGWISIEDGVNGWDEMRASVDFLNEARETYFGGSRDIRITAVERARERVRGKLA